MRAETRRQLKTDRFSKTTIQVAEQTVHWSVEHKGKLIVGAIVFLALVGALIGSWFYVERQDDRASADFGKAVQTLDLPIRPAGMPAQPDNPSFASSKEQATEARKQFQAIIDNYPHTRAAAFSRYFLGASLANLGDNAGAERELKAAADHRRYLVLRDNDLSALARLALAELYTNTNRAKDAIAIYKDLAANPSSTVGKPTAEMGLAEAYQSAGMLTEAKKEYEQIQKESPSGPPGQMAAQKLQELK